MGGEYEALRNDNYLGNNQGSWRKTCPSATLSTMNPTWITIGHDSHPFPSSTILDG
jgi:hypothetical protein